MQLLFQVHRWCTERRYGLVPLPWQFCSSDCCVPIWLCLNGVWGSYASVAADVVVVVSDGVVFAAAPFRVASAVIAAADVVVVVAVFVVGVVCGAVVVDTLVFLCHCFV